MKLYIGADHRGFSLKEKIKDLLQEKNVLFEDLGNNVFDPRDDYPEFALRVAQKVKQEPDALGVVVCGSGAGVDITANKLEGIRSALAINSEQIKQVRQDDNVNIIALAADFIKEEELEPVITTFLNTPYEPSEKHQRRLDQIKKIEHEV